MLNTFIYRKINSKTLFTLIPGSCGDSRDYSTAFPIAPKKETLLSSEQSLHQRHISQPVSMPAAEGLCLHSKLQDKYLWRDYHAKEFCSSTDPSQKQLSFSHSLLFYVHPSPPLISSAFAKSIKHQSRTSD